MIISGLVWERVKSDGVSISTTIHAQIWIRAVGPKTPTLTQVIYHDSMPYLIVRESFLSGCCLVDGLPLTEFRILGEKCSTCPDMRDEKNRRMEFPTNTITILNSLEMMGYKVVTSGAFSGSAFGTFSHKEFIWTLHRSSNDMDHIWIGVNNQYLKLKMPYIFVRLISIPIKYLIWLDKRYLDR